MAAWTLIGYTPWEPPLFEPHHVSASRPAVLLGTARATASFALTVFVATTVQVLATPISALIEGGGQWPFPLPEAVVFALLVLGCGVQAIALAFSDRFPQIAVAVIVVVHLALAIGLGVPTWLTGMYLVIALSLFLLATRRRKAIAFAWLAATVICLIGGLLMWMLAIGTPWSAAFWWIVAETARFAAPAAAGATLGAWWSTKVGRMREAREAAETARLEHEARVARAQESERARIAQELHDVAGQHLAGLITLADAALTIAPERPVRALELIGEVREEGRFAAASLAGALADLRATTADSAATVPDLRDVEDLLQFWRARGMIIELSALEDISDLPAVVSATAYRCVQEALTNTAKHAPGAAVRVDVALPADRLRVLVSNGAATTADPLPGLGLGWGLKGIAERVELLQGTLSTRALDSGGWELRIEIPTFAAE